MTIDATEMQAPRKRGPNTPEGKARSSMNALKHGLRAEKFRLLPEETVEEFEAFAEEVRKDLRPRCAMERQFVEAIVIAFWRETRADRMEADVMSDMPPTSPDRVHGSNLVNKPENRASLATMLRYRGQVSMDLKRALANLAAYRRGRGSAPEEDCPNQSLVGDFAPISEPANENYTNDFPPAAKAADENYTNELAVSESSALSASPTPEPPCPGEPERGGSPLSETFPTAKCTNDLSPAPKPAPQRPVVHRKEKVPLHHRRWW